MTPVVPPERMTEVAQNANSFPARAEQHMHSKPLRVAAAQAGQASPGGPLLIKFQGYTLRRMLMSKVGKPSCNNGSPWELVQVKSKREGDVVVEVGVHSRSMSTFKSHAVWTQGGHFCPRFFLKVDYDMLVLSDYHEALIVPDLAKNSINCKNGSNKGEEWLILNPRCSDRAVELVVFVLAHQMSESERLYNMLHERGMVHERNPLVQKSRQLGDDAEDLQQLTSVDASNALPVDEYEMCFSVMGANAMKIATFFHLHDFQCITEDLYNGKPGSTKRIHVERMSHFAGCTVTTVWKHNPREATLQRDKHYLDFLNRILFKPLCHNPEAGFSAVTQEGLAAQITQARMKAPEEAAAAAAQATLALKAMEGARKEQVGPEAMAVAASLAAKAVGIAADAKAVAEATHLPEPLKSYVHNEECRLLQSPNVELCEPPQLKLITDAQRSLLLTCWWWHQFGKVPGPPLGPFALPNGEIAIRLILQCALLHGDFVKYKNDYDTHRGTKVGQGNSVRSFRDGRFHGLKIVGERKPFRGSRGKFASAEESYQPKKKKARV